MYVAIFKFKEDEKIRTAVVYHSSYDVIEQEIERMKKYKEVTSIKVVEGEVKEILV